MSRSIAVVTMVYNEPEFLPIWVSYYAKQYGEAACYIIDHGSDDGSTMDLGQVNVVKIPRSPKHNKKRANYVSRFCSSLLEWYDGVIYTDVDEILVADPEFYSSLRDLTDRTPKTTIRAIGLNVTHLPDSEPDFDPALPILNQRRWARFAFAMCKPLFTCGDINWTPGFHSSDRDADFDHLFLLHLHNFDLTISLRRLARTRSMPWGDGPPDHYQRWPDQKHDDVARAIARLPKINDSTFREEDPTLAPYLSWMTTFIADNPDKRHLFYYKNDIQCNELLHIPDRFLGVI